MKTCTYCGQEYKDDVLICPSDRQPLAPSASTTIRNPVRGVWRGMYGYREPAETAGLPPVPFTLKLQKSDLLGRFAGTVTDDCPPGMPGTGTVDGYLGASSLQFTKQMPVGYVREAGGRLVTLREYLTAQGRECPEELRAAPMLYEGEFLDANRIQGVWRIEPGQIDLPDGSPFAIRASSGAWCAQFITDDLNAEPTGGPAEPLFEPLADAAPAPSLLPESSGAAEFTSLGTFNVLDSQRLLKEFEAAGLRVELRRDDSAMKQMPPFMEGTGGYSGTAPLIEIFVHPEDAEAAAELVGKDAQI